MVKGKEMLNFDLNTEPEDEEAGNVLGFQADFVEKQTEIESNGSSSKRRKYSIEEKGKAKINDHDLDLDLDLDLNLNLGDLREMEIDDCVEEEKENLIDIWSGSLNLDSTETNNNFMDVSISSPDQEINDVEKRRREQALLSTMEQVSRRKAEARRQHEIARKFAQRDLMEFSVKKEKKILSSKQVDDSQQSPFLMAMEMIKKRNYNNSVRNKCAFEQEFKWVPSKGCNFSKREVPSLLDLSLNALAKNGEAIVSLELVPDVLRHKLSQAVCDSRKMNARFVQLLAKGSPTEIRVKDSSCLIEGEISNIFGSSCDTKHLTVSDSLYV